MLPQYLKYGLVLDSVLSHELGYTSTQLDYQDFSNFHFLLLERFYNL